MVEEWEAKPDCFGNLKKENMRECKDCGYMQTCLGVTYIAAMKDVMENQKTSSPPTSIKTFPPPKSPSPEKIIQGCKEAIELCMSKGFNREEAFALIIHFYHPLVFEQIKDEPNEGT